jgi:translation initiation factor 1A
MVKNTTGGSKTKGQARKFVTAPTKQTLRISQDELEVYAQVIKNLGNGMCHVTCIDGETRLCHIRGKFRGRGKRDNLVGNGTWLLVGLREWELSANKKPGKLENCDLLEVYNDLDVQRLKDTVNENWSVFATSNSSNAADTSDDVEFEDEKTSEYHDLIESQLAGVKNSTSIALEEAEDEVDANDI